MNTEFYNKLKANDVEEKNINSLSKLITLTQKKINRVEGLENYIPIITAFYSYVKENYDAYLKKTDETLRKDGKEERKILEKCKGNYAPFVSKYYTREKIEEKFDDLVSDDNYLNIIVELGSDELYKNLSEVASIKLKKSNKYKSSYDKIKNAFINNNIDPKYFTDIELAQEKNVSDSAKDIIGKIDEFDKIVDAKPLETPVLDNSNINEYEKIANSAMDKINKLVSERNIELPKEDKTEEKNEEPKENSNSYDFSKFDDNYSSIKSMNDNLDKKEQELIEKQRKIEMERKRVDRLEQRRENEMVLNASDDLGVSKEKLDNVISKSGIDLKDVDKIIISKEMLDSVANGYIASLSNNKFNNFLENVSRGNKLKNADFAVENLDGVNILKINSNDAVSKIASCEQKLFNKISSAAQKKASLKNRIVSLANKTKEEIISRISEAKERVEDSVYETRKNISNKLYHMAGKMSPDDYLSYDTSGRTPIEGFSNNFNSNHNDDDHEKVNEEADKDYDEKRNSPEEKEITSILDEVNERRDHSEPKKVDDRELNKILDDLKNNRTYANSGTYVGNTESKIEEEIHKSK